MTNARRLLAGPSVVGVDDYLGLGGGKAIQAARHRTSE